MSERHDAVVIGGGFYGLRIALHLRESLGLQDILVLEAEPELMSRASYANQARVHNGYHYPRSILTGYRSNVNLPRFREEYADAVVSGFTHHYAVARSLSRTNARQFETFCKRIGSFVRDAPADVSRRFNPVRVERVFTVEEPAFDSRVLRELLIDRIRVSGGIDVRTGIRVDRVGGADGDIEVVAGDGTHRAPNVINATYAGINTLHANSGLPLIDVQHELTEMALVSLPPGLEGSAVTVMDGPFFSIMPFPSRGLHTLSHVRYTPHRRWREGSGASAVAPYAELAGITRRSSYAAMHADVVRYLPAASDMLHRDSLFEVKTVLTRSSDDDSRPILFRRDIGPRGYTCVLGGKLDNIYDVLAELEDR